jgi:GAF domain-containing protein
LSQSRTSQPQHRLVRPIVVGFLVAAAVTAAMSPAAGNSSFSKAAIYLAVIALVGALLGPATAAVTAVFSMVGFWFVFYSPHYSFSARSWEDVAGFVSTAFTAAIIVMVVARLERSQHRAQAGERRVREVLRVGFGLTSARTRPELRAVLAEDFRSLLGASSIAVVEPSGDASSWGLTVGYEGRVDPEWVGLVDKGTPALEALATGEPIYLPTVEELERRWPHLTVWTDALGETARAALPVPLEDGSRGGVTIGWHETQRFDGDQRELIETLVAMLASALRRIRRSERAAEAEFGNVLEAMLDGVAVYRAVRDPAGVVLDFELRFFNRRAAVMEAGTGPYVGRALTDVYPPAVEAGLLAALVRVLETGEPFVRDPYRFRTPDGAGRPVSISASRQDSDTVVLVVRDVSERERVQREREVAIAEATRSQTVVDELQRAFLPQELPALAAHGIEARYVPAEPDTPVGGDWYDAFITPSGTLLLVVGDVAGHGVAASGLMSLIRSAIRAYASESRSPSEILDGADRLVASMDGFATCWLAAYDPESGVFTWSNAGHPPALVAGRDESRYVFGEPDAPLGLATRTRFERSDVLAVKESLVLYSDGLIERRHEPLTVGLERLLELATRLDPTDVTLADELVAGTPAGPGPGDDLCVLVLQRS